MAKLLTGKEVGRALNAATKERVAELVEQGFQPKLVVVRVGDDKASAAYERSAIRVMERLGIEGEAHHFEESATTEDLIEEINRLNEDDSVSGVIIMQPLPEHIGRKALSEHLDPKKDVDAINPMNMGYLIEGSEDAMVPSTAQAVLELLDYYDIDVRGKDICVVGASPVVGQPLAVLLTNRMATVSNCHIETRDTRMYTKQAEIVVSATGALELIDDSYISEGAVVIDVGYGVTKDGRTTGDVKFDAVEPIASAITPVPNGVGSVTTAVLAKQVLRGAEHIANKGK